MVDPLSPLKDGLIPAALRSEATRGRRIKEDEHPFRNPFQRDRDRIIHAAAFRRLEYKTQVFVNGEGDNYRTRLTHTLEVAQIARTIARALHTNEDFAEAVALSHDLGHTPFGHAGERVLDDKLANLGGFNHNVQGLRVVDMLEKRYAAFDGLNLNFETREAFVRHGGVKTAQTQFEFDVWDAPLLEVAATMAADDIAYIAHDIDDGLFSGMLRHNQLSELELWREATSLSGFGGYSETLKRTQGVRRVIDVLASDLIDSSRRRLAEFELDSPEKVRKMSETVVVFSSGMEKKKAELKEFLFANFYRHPNLMEVIEEAQILLARLFDYYVANRECMPLEYRKIADNEGVQRAAADYVAGMTDRFARDAGRRIFGGR